MLKILKFLKINNKTNEIEKPEKPKIHLLKSLIIRLTKPKTKLIINRKLFCETKIKLKSTTIKLVKNLSIGKILAAKIINKVIKNKPKYF